MIKIYEKNLYVIFKKPKLFLTFFLKIFMPSGKKEATDQLNLTLKHFMKMFPNGDDFFITEDHDVDYLKLKTFIEEKTRVEFSRQLLNIKRYIYKLKQLGREIKSFEFPDNPKSMKIAEALHQKCQEFLDIFLKESKEHQNELKRIQKEYTKYHSHLQEAELTLVQEIESLKKQNKQQQQQINQLFEKLNLNKTTKIP